MEIAYMPMKGWMAKEDVVCIYNGILLSHEKMQSFHFDNMDGTWGYYAKWNKSDRERKILYDFTYVWNITNKQKPK